MHAGKAPATQARTANPAVAPRALPACDSTFSQINALNPGAVYNTVANNGLAAISPTDVWAVGAYGDTNFGPDKTLAMRWNGSGWSQVPTNNTGPSNDDIWGVATVPGAAAANDNVWTAGDYTDGSNVEHVEAALWATPGAWAYQHPANISGGNNVLLGVTAITASNVWAVGYYRVSNGDPNAMPPIPPSPAQTLIGHWDGANFTTAAGPQVSGTSSDRLVSVSASGPNDVWAVGRSSDGGFINNLILHYNGTTWSITPSPNVGLGATNTLYSVKALSPTLAYAVGNHIDVSTGLSDTLIEKWDGVSWGVVASPNPIAGDDNYLFSVSALSSTSIWAGGASYATNASQTPTATMAEHWDGTSWKAVAGYDGNSGNFNEFNAILAVSPTEIWAAGDYVDPSNRLLYRAARFRHSAEQVRDNALAVAGLLSDRIGGPSVMPYQPPDFYQGKYERWQWMVSQGEDAHRRGLYTFWRRTSLHPMFALFDAPSREECTVVRSRTSVVAPLSVSRSVTPGSGMNSGSYNQSSCGRPRGIRYCTKGLSCGWKVKPSRLPPGTVK